jgi:hypothetical protein
MLAEAAQDAQRGGEKIFQKNELLFANYVLTS